jgi:AraC-like DNA-binding protein
MDKMPLSLHLRIFRHEKILIDKDWNAQNVYSSFWRIYQNDKSGSYLILDSGRFPLKGKQIHLVPPWIRFSCENSSPIEHTYAHFEIVGWSRSLIQPFFHQPISLQPDATLDQLANIWTQSLAPRDDLDPTSVLCSKSLIHLAIFQILSRFETTQLNELSRRLTAEPRLAPAVESIENRFHLKLTNQQLAKTCHLSEDYFIRLFKKTYGITPNNYLLEKRLEKAAQLLIFSNEGIDIIAEQCGFTDRYYFTRMFTRQMGLPPATYRRTQQLQG